ncbi:MAG: M50 family metallopeptidase [Butyricicoccus sp.]
MNSLLSNLPGIVLALLAFGLLIMLHELGHLVAAKRGGIKVEEFWIGMGPVLWAHPFGETKYCLRLLPIGGACVMEGEDGEAVSDRSFVKASRLRRFLVLVAGVLMNFLTGFVILLFLLPGGSDGRIVTPTLDSFYEGFRHEGEDGLMVGDTLLEIDGYKIHQRSDVDIAIAQGAADGKFDIVVRRNGEKVYIDGLEMQPDVNVDGQLKYGLHFATEEITLPLRVKTAFWESVSLARVIWDSLGDLVSGQVGMDQLSGPVGVTGVMAQTAQTSLRSFWYLVSFISINLGVMNLLPIPGLDGGRLLFLLVEAVRRKPLGPKLEGYVNAAGLVLLLGLMVYVTGNDVLRLLG